MPRELIDTGNDKRYVRRNAQGQFDDVVDVGKSLSQDRKRKAKRVVKAGEGDRGDQKPRPRQNAASKKASSSPAKKASTTQSRTTKSKPTAQPRSKAKASTKSRTRGR